MIDVLAYYTKLQLVTALEWNLPVQSQKDVRTEAQFSSLNDCNMRTYVNQFEYAAMVDFDEFIIPKAGANLLELIGNLYNDSSCTKHDSSLHKPLSNYKFLIYTFICSIIGRYSSV